MRSSESGQVIVLMTGALITLLGMMGIVLDVGIHLEQRRQLQNAVDAAAHAGAQMLPNTAAAQSTADVYFDANRPSGGPSTFTVAFPTPDREQIEVIGSMELKYTILSLFGKDSATVSVRAVAGAQLTDIVLSLDRSGSMCRDSHYLTSTCPAPPPAHEPMTSVKVAADGFSDLFEPGYTRVGLVSFATQATLDLTASANFGSGSALESAITNIYPSGSTNIGDAILRARNDVINGVNTRPDALKIIVLLSDGVPNRCAGGASCTEAQAATYSRSQAQAAAAQGITIYTIGLGASADDALLQDLATLGNGVYVPSPTAGDLGATFDKIAALIKVKILE
ncbi:MAG: VWA domain-containing protein [Chloroflexi bacterium]|nr:VWA domain-containing protein [Chloroflexota bacterium]